MKTNREKSREVLGKQALDELEAVDKEVNLKVIKIEKGKPSICDEIEEYPPQTKRRISDER